VAQAGVFAHGVASGDPTPERVVLWTRVTRPAAIDPIDVGWLVGRDADLRDVVVRGTAQATSERDWTVHVDVAGLDPATTYFYAFDALGETSPVGRTRTLPVGPVEHLRFAFVSCAKFNAGFFNGYGRIADRDDLDFVLHLGDYIYEAAQNPPASQTPGADIGRPMEPLNECRTLDDYRTRYAQYRRDPDVQAMHARHPLIATLDDHEYADGAWRGGSLEHRDDRDGPWADRRAAAIQARWEWLPARPPDPDQLDRVWRSVPYGELVDLLLVDTRSFRDEPAGGDAMTDATRTQLGEAQRDWLLAELAASKARWRILGNASVLGHIWHDTLGDIAHRPLAVIKLIGPDGGEPDDDQWDGYAAERQQILEHLRDVPVRDVVVLSGDVHVSLAMDISLAPFDPAAPNLAVEFVTTSLTSQNMDDKMHWPPRTQSVPIEAALVDALPHLHWAEFDSHGYAVVDVTPERVVGEWWFVETVLEPSREERLGAAWLVAHGNPTLVPAAATAGSSRRPPAAALGPRPG
jgi:alkaline phosphatase D